MSCRLPWAAADSGRLASIFNLTGRLAPRYSRYSHLDQAPCESCGISRFFSAATIFGLAVSLVAPVAAADASCLAWISHLTGRQAPRRLSSVDRHQAPCKSRGVLRFSQRRRFFSAATIFGVVASLVATPGAEITTRAVGRPQLGRWYLVRLRRPF